MSSSTQPIRINVDVTNPGQFFACCGLLELANRLWSGADGWFCGGKYCLACQGSLFEIIRELKGSGLRVCTEEGEPSIHPIRLERFDLTLSWWLRDDWSRFQGKPKDKRGGFMKTALKFWAGNQSSFLLVRNLLATIRIPEPETESQYFQPSELISSRFGLDAGAAWTALDVGFSINEHPMDVKASAAVELLAAIGLQRCRPVNQNNVIDYTIWGVPIGPALLSAAVCGEIETVSSIKYRAHVIDRGSYSAFAHSYPLKGASRE